MKKLSYWRLRWNWRRDRRSVDRMMGREFSSVIDDIKLPQHLAKEELPRSTAEVEQERSLAPRVISPTDFIEALEPEDFLNQEELA